MSTVLRDLSNGTRRRAEVRFDWPGSVLFEVDGERLTCTYCGPETKSARLDRVPALRIFMEEYKRFFDRMQVISPRSNGDYDVALDYMKYFKKMRSKVGAACRSRARSPSRSGRCGGSTSFGAL